jgi:pectate lyase
MPESSNKTQIIVAIIGLVGVLLAALIANRSKTAETVAIPCNLPQGQRWERIANRQIIPLKDQQYPGSYAYMYEGDGVKLAAPDNNDNGHASNLRLLEDCKPLGPPHSLHAEIWSKGEGRYSHWGVGANAVLYFSASDNSDPTVNRKEYMVTVATK